MAAANKKYKDSLFCFIFGKPENLSWTLDLFNAINHSNYTDASQIRINTIDTVLYLGLHNDVSFMLSNMLNLYEHQSRYNPNMPLRQLQYTCNLLEKYVKENKLNKYGTSLIKLPTPKLIVLYNGLDEKPDETILRLSDSFSDNVVPDVEASVRMININYDPRRKILTDCEILRNYSWFIHQIRNNQKKMPLDDAIGLSINQMPEDWPLRRYLDIHRLEVKDMLLTDYDENEVRELFKEDGRREGLKQGIEQGLEQGIEKGIEQGLEQGLEQGIKQGIEKGIEQGIKTGETKLGALIKKLCLLGLQDDIQKVADDQEYRNNLYHKYGIIS